MGGTSPSNNIQRAQNYVWKLVPSRVSTSLGLQLLNMQHGMKIYLPIEMAIRYKIAAILSGHAVPTVKIAGYMAAGLRMWSLKKRLGAAGAQAEISYVVATWTSRGYDAGYLADVRDLVTGVLAP